MKVKQGIQDQTEEVRQKENHEKKRKLVGSMRPNRGHTLYQYNTKTGELIPATFEQQDADFIKAQKGNSLGKRKVVIAQEGCIYVSALNIKNAVKRLSKSHGVSLKIQ